MQLVIFDWGSTLFNSEEDALFSETKPTLEYLHSKGFSMAIVSLATAGPTKIEERLNIIKQEKLEKYFESIKFNISNKDQMYQDTLTELKVDPADVVIVDDRVVRGISWGNAHGCKTVWLRQGRFANELPNEFTGEPEYVIHTIGELSSVL